MIKLLNPPKPKNSFIHYRDAFDYELERYKRNGEESLFWEGEGKLVYALLEEIEGMSHKSYIWCKEFWRTAELNRKYLNGRILEWYVKQWKKEQRKLGNYEIYFDDGSAVVFENNEKVFEDVTSNHGKHYYYCKEGWSFETSEFIKAKEEYIKQKRETI
jgi:hypothetical protein